MESKKDKKLMGAGILTAIAASLCCITPVLALFAGASGIASTFSWIEPFRPYLIWITILVLAFAWYQKLKPKNQEIDCECEPARSAGGEDEKPSFWQTKMFLGVVTVFAGAMLAFPHYSYIFYPAKKAGVVASAQSTINESIYQVKGMTCESCNLHVENEVAKLPGYIDAKADYKTGTVKVKYDNTKSSEIDVKNTINSTGYKIIDSKNSTNEPVNYSSIFMNVKGMTCESCNLHVEHEVSKLPGYIDAKADYKTGTVKVKYDSLKSSKKDVIDAVNSTGYKIVENNKNK
jgi:copper ion binding protein